MYVVSYDIASDRLRNKIAKTLEGYGNRMQYSVFECRIEEKRFKQLYHKLMTLMEGCEEGNVRIYYICGNCREKIHTIGQISEAVESLEQKIIVI